MANTKKNIKNDTTESKEVLNVENKTTKKTTTKKTAGPNKDLTVKTDEKIEVSKIPQVENQNIEVKSTLKNETEKLAENVDEKEEIIIDTTVENDSKIAKKVKKEIVDKKVEEPKNTGIIVIDPEDESKVDIEKDKLDVVLEKKKKKKKKEKEIERYEVSIKQGLTDEQVAKRVQEKLTNVFDNKNTKSIFKIICQNLFTFFNILCITVALALLASGAEWNQFLFVIIFFCNFFIGVIQEIRAKMTVDRICLMESPTATVIRNGEKKEIFVKDIVLDDIIQLSSGKQISTDCIIQEGKVEVNESLLTGESVPVKKKKGDFLYSGSYIVGGKCIAKVEQVGENCYTAKLAVKAKKLKKTESDLLKGLNAVIKGIALIIIPLAILTFYNAYKSGKSLNESILNTAGSVVGMIPAGMFLLTSMALAVGVIKLARKRTLVQNLYSVEMLARTDVLCLDKTGTITDGTMKVYSVVQMDLSYTESMNDIIGSMLTALDDNNSTSLALADHFGYSKEYTAKAIIPFSSDRKFSAVTFRNGETYMYGAPEFILKNKQNPIIEKQVKNFAKKGFRVLLFARVEGEIENDKLSDNRTPICLIIVEDHIREDAHKTLQWFKDNGVQIKIISGDNPITVSEVSKRVGVENANLYINLEGLSEQQVIEAADKYTVFGRVSPEQKCIIVKALKNKKHKVAMTGDGVNDILALKEADCSIAMASGSDATKNVSNLVLLDSNFASMPSVVAEGRRVINNIQNSSSLFLMKTIFVILITIFFLCVPDASYPFTPSSMLLLENLVIGIPSFFLALQPNNEPIKGNFLLNLFARAFPGALIMLFDVIICYVCDVLGFITLTNTALEFIPAGTSSEFVTIAALSVSLTGLLILFNLCKPFNFYRGLMFTLLSVLFIAILVYLPWTLFFPISTIPPVQDILIMIILVQVSYPLYTTVLGWFNKLTQF